MLVLIADANIEGHVHALYGHLMRSEWSELAELLQINIRTLSDFGIHHDDNDRVVWNAIQQHGAILLTANRNDDSEDSLKATIDDSNTLTSLPVITLSDEKRFYRDREYADRCVEKLMEYLLYLDSYRGTGRLYIP